MFGTKGRFGALTRWWCLSLVGLCLLTVPRLSNAQAPNRLTLDGVNHAPHPTQRANFIAQPSARLDGGVGIDLDLAFRLAEGGEPSGQTFAADFLLGGTFGQWLELGVATELYFVEDQPGQPPRAAHFGDDRYYAKLTGGHWSWGEVACGAAVSAMMQLAADAGDSLAAGESLGHLRLVVEGQHGPWRLSTNAGFLLRGGPEVSLPADDPHLGVIPASGTDYLSAAIAAEVRVWPVLSIVSEVEGRLDISEGSDAHALESSLALQLR